MTVDFCIIAGGIAGLSIAAELSKTEQVVLIERESDLAYHTSGRSAALYSELTAHANALTLSTLSNDFFKQAPPGFTD